MAYDTKGLKRLLDGIVNVWLLDSTDVVATAGAAGYISDGYSSTTNGTPGKGMNIGDLVLYRQVGAITGNGIPPAAVSDTAWFHVSAVNTATGAITLTAT